MVEHRHENSSCGSHYDWQWRRLQTGHRFLEANGVGPVSEGDENSARSLVQRIEHQLERAVRLRTEENFGS